MDVQDHRSRAIAEQFRKYFETPDVLVRELALALPNETLRITERSSCSTSTRPNAALPLLHPAGLAKRGHSLAPSLRQLAHS
jgi:hypothetical protein